MQPGPRRRQRARPQAMHIHPGAEPTTLNRTSRQYPNMLYLIHMNRSSRLSRSRFVKTSATPGQVEALPPNRVTSTGAQQEWNAPTVRPRTTTPRPRPRPRHCPALGGLRLGFAVATSCGLYKSSQDGRGEDLCRPMSTTGSHAGLWTTRGQGTVNRQSVRLRPTEFPCQEGSSGASVFVPSGRASTAE